ncbi:hypothetical protein GCM10027601_14940 [Nocardioides ungokensis]
MIAPMFGMIMLDRNVPNFCTCTRADRRGTSLCVAVAMLIPFSGSSRGWLLLFRRACPDVTHVMFNL